MHRQSKSHPPDLQRVARGRRGNCPACRGRPASPTWRAGSRRSIVNAGLDQRNEVGDRERADLEDPVAPPDDKAFGLIRRPAFQQKLATARAIFFSPTQGDPARPRGGGGGGSVKVPGQIGRAYTAGASSQCRSLPPPTPEPGLGGPACGDAAQVPAFPMRRFCIKISIRRPSVDRRWVARMAADGPVLVRSNQVRG